MEDDETYQFGGSERVERRKETERSLHVVYFFSLVRNATGSLFYSLVHNHDSPAQGTSLGPTDRRGSHVHTI